MTDTLHAAARRLIAARSEEDLYHVAVSALAQSTGADCCELALTADDSLDSRASVTFEPVNASLASPLNSHRSLLEHAHEIGELGLVDDLTAVRSATGRGDSAGTSPYRSLLCVPIGERGLLVAADHDPGFFSGTDLSAVTHLADYVAAGLDRCAVGGPDEPSRHEAVANVISHDVQNAINVADGRLVLAREEVDSEHLEVVARALDRLADMTDDVVTVLRTGDSVTAIEPVDLGRVATRAWDAVETAEATLAVDESTRIMADSSSLCQLLENLFRNAVDHAGDDVTVTVGVLADDGIYVEDDGPGIPPDERDAVFEMGYSTGGGSTGYGLAIVHQIASAHAWTVSVTEGDTAGARFAITGIGSP